MRTEGRARIPAGERHPLRVLVVDDHPIVRKGLVEAINDEPDLVVCGEAATSTAALAAVTTQQPDVVIVDLSLGHENGLDLVATLAISHPRAHVLVLSGHDERLFADRALKAGALGYVMKGEPATTLLMAVRRVASGKTYVSSDTADRILSSLGPSKGARSDSSAPDSLTDRERHVLMLIGRGLATREIAKQLDLSVKTVESHYANLKRKLGARNGRELVRVAVHWAESIQSEKRES